MQSKNELSNPSQPVRTRLVTSAIPQHYIVRPNRLETVFLAAASVVTGILLVAYLMAARGMDDDATQLYRILLGVLFLACFAYTLKNVWSWLEVDGEQLRYHVWRQRTLNFTFSDLLFVQTKRNTLLFQGRSRSTLFRLRVNMENAGILLAELRSRNVTISESVPADSEVLTPGPHEITEDFELPDAAPARYTLARPWWLKGLVALAAVCFAALLIYSVLLDTPLFMAAIAVIGMVLSLVYAVRFQAERMEVADGRVRYRSVRFQTSEFSLDDVASVRQRITFAMFFPLSAAELLDQEGRVLACSSGTCANNGLLLADLTDRGIPFTY